MPRLRGRSYSRRARPLRRRMRGERTVAVGRRGEGPLEYLTEFTSQVLYVGKSYCNFTSNNSRDGVYYNPPFGEGWERGF
jgi:hypothetical protein